MKHMLGEVEIDSNRSGSDGANRLEIDSHLRKVIGIWENQEPADEAPLYLRCQ
jgi:hypothetical protein